MNTDQDFAVLKGFNAFGEETVNAFGEETDIAIRSYRNRSINKVPLSFLYCSAQLIGAAKASISVTPLSTAPIFTVPLLH